MTTSLLIYSPSSKYERCDVVIVMMFISDLFKDLNSAKRINPVQIIKIFVSVQ